MTTEIGNPVTTPAYFVEILFTTPLHLSSRGTVDWNGSVWISRDVSISGLRYDVGSPQQTGNLVMGDLDGSVTALVLQQGIAGRTINIWKFYGTAPAPTDPVQIFSGAGDGVSMDERSGGVNISLVQRSARELYAPRRFMTRANGFSILPVIGRIVSFNGENFKLERDRG
jgi:hypothetical protein